MSKSKKNRPASYKKPSFVLFFLSGIIWGLLHILFNGKPFNLF